MSVLAAVNTDINAGRRIRGMKDAEKQEAVFALSELRDRIADLIGLHITARDAAADYADACWAVAEKAGLEASVVRKFVKARAGDKFYKLKRDADQLQMCFDEIGG